MPDLRVLHVINGLGAGGAERSLRELLPLFPTHGIASEVAVFFERDRGVEAEVVASGTTVHHVEAEGWVRRIAGLRKLVAERRPDVVHSTLFDADIVSRLAAIRTQSRVVSSLVNTSYGEAHRNDPRVSNVRLTMARQLDGLTARHLTSRFHAISTPVKTAAVDTLGIAPSLVTVIPRGRSRARLGHPSSERRRGARARLGIDEDAFVIANVGRQEYQKAQSNLIEAVAVLADRGMRVEVVVAGREGHETSGLRDLVSKHRLGDRVRFLGHVDEVPEVLAAADVFVFPSRYEGLGGSVLEALALEVPIVATDIPAVREILEAGRLGLLVPVDRPAHLADAIDQVRRDPAAAASRARAGQAAFESRYRLDAVAHDMAEWLHSAAG